jgi:hypothetical protein
MELSHEPIPFGSGGVETVPRWPPDNARVDPFRRHQEWMWLLMGKDYAQQSVTIQQAMLMERKLALAGSRDISVNWGGRQVRSFDWISVPDRGTIRIELLRYAATPRQAVDVRAANGAIVISPSEHVPVLRTWADSEFEDTLVYSYACSGELCISTATETRLPNGNLEIERFTGNSGFWIEERDGARTYHASSASAPTPDFESLVFSIQIASQ